MVIPMKNQYEQQLNAAALKEMGVPVIKNLHDKNDMIINAWIDSSKIIEVNYPDMTHEIINQIIDKHCHSPKIVDFKKYGNH